MRHQQSTGMIVLLLCTSGALTGARGGCGGSQDTRPLDDPLHADPPQCGAVCELYCAHGNVLDANGCPTCSCNPPPACISDSECAQDEVCDFSVCLSPPCVGQPPDIACPAIAVCYGQCISAPTTTSCDPADANACAEGLVCVCDGGPQPLARESSDARPGLLPPPPTDCTCQPISPPPPPPDTCDPANPVCENGGTCVCAAYAGAACDPSDGSCDFPQPPAEQCYCIEPPPPPPTCDPSAPQCENGGECVCYVACVACQEGVTCIPPEPECYCVEPPPPPPQACDPNNPVCDNGGDCVCYATAEGGHRSGGDGGFARPAPLPEECYCADPETKPVPPPGGSGH